MQDSYTITIPQNNSSQIADLGITDVQMEIENHVEKAKVYKM